MNTPQDIDLQLKEEDLVFSKQTGLEIKLRSQGELGSLQKEILQKLPNIKEYAHTLCKFAIEHSLNEKKREKPLPNDESLKKLIAGKIFEDLVQTENNLKSFVEQEKSPNLVDLSDETPEMRDKRAKFTIKFTELMHDAGKFGFSFWDIEGFNPDISFIETRFNKETGDMMLVITAVGEAKSGNFDSRMYKQITSFRESLVRMIETVNGLTTEQAKNHNLDGFGIAGTRIGLIRKFKEVVIVPQQKDISKENITRLVDISSFRHGTKEENDYHYDLFCEILKGKFPEKYNIVFKKSAFSGSDLHTISEHIMEEIWLELENDLSGPLSGAVAQHKHR